MQIRILDSVEVKEQGLLPCVTIDPHELVLAVYAVEFAVGRAVAQSVAVFIKSQDISQDGGFVYLVDRSVGPVIFLRVRREVAQVAVDTVEFRLVGSLLEHD